MSVLVAGWRVAPAAPLVGQLAVPPDQALAVRAILLATLADDDVRILGADPFAPLVANAIAGARALGCRVAEAPDGVVVSGRAGRFGVPGAALETLGDPATIALLGALAARQAEGTYTLAGDRGASTEAIVAVLRAQGSEVLTGADGLPIRIVAGTPLERAEHVLPGGSDVLKLIGLVAGLGAEGGSTVVELAASPDSAERMIRSLGGRLDRRGPRVTHVVPSTLSGGVIELPGDADVAAAFVLAATLVPGSTLYLTGVGANPGRSALVGLLERMGARIGTSGRRQTAAGETIVDLEVRSAELVGADIDADLALALGPQLPLALIAVACARGRSRLRAELQLDDEAVDRAARHLFAIGAHPRITDRGLDVQGVPARVRGGAVADLATAGGALAFAVAGLYSESGVSIDDASALDRDYPAFRSLLAALVAPRFPS
jgi:3-phosphoshikimate 1-carboxyvinyltransferase